MKKENRNMSTLAEAVESNEHLISIWGAMALDRGGEVSTDEGVVRMWADGPFGFWNTVALDGQDIPTKALGDQLARAAQFMRKGKQAGYLWVFEDLLSPAARQELPSQAAEVGLELAFTGYGMAGDLAIPDPVHPGLDFRRVKTEHDLITFGQINAWAYGMSEEAGLQALAGSEFWLRETCAYIAYHNGRPVACAATVKGADSLFLALVATAPEAMRRGYGEAVSRKAIYEGIKETGHQYLVLHATQAGRPVYERIGYKANSLIYFFQPV
jgi:hypothetical protein